MEVKKALTYPKNSEERHVQLDHLRNKGNYLHNRTVVKTQKGKLIPAQQPQTQLKGHEFLHCIHCYGLFKRCSIWRHFRRCKLKPLEASKPGKQRVQALCAFAEPVPAGFSALYWKFLSEMLQDEISLAIKEDQCLLEFGYRLFTKSERQHSHYPYIRQKLRELARLVLEAKEISPVKSLKELIKPEMYSCVVKAAKRLAGLNEETGKYKRPSLARKVGHSLHSVALFLKSEALKMKDQQSVQDVSDFAQLYTESWKYDIASQALTQLNQEKWNAPELLPFTQDVLSLHSFLASKLDKTINALKQNPVTSDWRELAKITLTQVILFNRRRSGEVSRMPLSVYLERDTSQTHDDVNLALSLVEQKLCKHFTRITIAGKRGRKVPVLLTPVMKESIELLISKREMCGVLKENAYLFALPKSNNYLRGSDCIRQFVKECKDLRTPQALTSTKLRKHIATLSTILNLKNTELDQLADFLGHNIAVHRKHYRLPEATLQIAKMSKVLLALDQGRLGEFKGMSLDDIDISTNGI